MTRLPTFALPDKTKGRNRKLDNYAAWLAGNTVVAQIIPTKQPTPTNQSKDGEHDVCVNPPRK